MPLDLMQDHVDDDRALVAGDEQGLTLVEEEHRVLDGGLAKHLPPTGVTPMGDSDGARTWRMASWALFMN